MKINGYVVIDSSDCLVDTSVLIGFDHTDHEVGIVVVVGGVVRGNCKCLSVSILVFSEFSYRSKFSITTHVVNIMQINTQLSYQINLNFTRLATPAPTGSVRGRRRKLKFANCGDDQDLGPGK